MTNQMGPKLYRFDYCDLKDMVGKLFTISFEITLNQYECKLIHINHD